MRTPAEAPSVRKMLSGSAGPVIMPQSVSKDRELTSNSMADCEGDLPTPSRAAMNSATSSRTTLRP